MAVSQSGAKAKAASQQPKQKKKFRLFSVANGFDMPMFILLMILLVVGLISLYSASYVYSFYKNGDSYLYIKRQLVFALLGVVAMLVMTIFIIIYLKFYRKYTERL